jgi:DNA-directed RNA polymerase specialized sigma24 family protein
MHCWLLPRKPETLTPLSCWSNGTSDRVCNGSAHNPNREDAEDVAQQSFQKAFIHLKKLEGNSLFYTWLTRLPINKAPMLLRRKRGWHEVPIEESSTKTESALPLTRIRRKV